MATIGAMKGLRALRSRVPQDIALVGFDDFDWADHFEPRLTVVAQPREEIGRQAAAMLIERVRGSQAAPRTVRLKPQLILRNSCGCTGDV